MNMREAFFILRRCTLIRDIYIIYNLYFYIIFILYTIYIFLFVYYIYIIYNGYMANFKSCRIGILIQMILVRNDLKITKILSVTGSRYG